MLKGMKNRWLKALRSGEYEQGESYLRSGENIYCCLGVLCNIIDSTQWVDENGDEIYTYGIEERKQDYLPESLRDKLRILEPEQRHLATMNDDGHTFEDIADWIEENL